MKEGRVLRGIASEDANTSADNGIAMLGPQCAADDAPCRRDSQPPSSLVQASDKQGEAFGKVALQVRDRLCPSLLLHFGGLRGGERGQGQGRLFADGGAENHNLAH